MIPSQIVIDLAAELEATARAIERAAATDIERLDDAHSLYEAAGEIRAFASEVNSITLDWELDDPIWLATCILLGVEAALDEIPATSVLDEVHKRIADLIADLIEVSQRVRRGENAELPPQAVWLVQELGETILAAA